MSLRPAAGSAFEWLQRDVAQWTGGTTAIRLMASALEDSTVEHQYGRHWATFCTWCAENSLEPLPATPRMIVAYIGTLAERGSIGAEVDDQARLGAVHASCTCVSCVAGRQAPVPKQRSRSTVSQARSLCYHNHDYSRLPTNQNHDFSRLTLIIIMSRLYFA